MQTKYEYGRKNDKGSITQIRCRKRCRIKCRKLQNIKEEGDDACIDQISEHRTYDRNDEERFDGVAVRSEGQVIDLF